jgi:hypothetical protein
MRSPDRTEAPTRSMPRGEIIWTSSNTSSPHYVLYQVLCDTGQKVHRKEWNLEPESPLEALASVTHSEGLTSGTDAL